MKISKKTLALLVMQTAFLSCQAQGLAEAYRDYWRTGISVNQWEVEAGSVHRGESGITGGSVLDQTAHFPVIVDNFKWLVAENCMKMEVVHPSEYVYDFTNADKFVDKAMASGASVIGHCLIWHSQCPRWFFYDNEGKKVTPEVLRKRMKEHIFTVVNHFKGRVKAWDVVNEAFEDNGSLRKSMFYEILGEDFIPLAFQYAHEADPSMELYYNDYSMNKEEKVRGIINFFKPLMAKGLTVTAIGLQGHLILGDDDYVSQYAKSIDLIKSELGLPSQFTELDLSVLPNPFGFSGANISDNFKYSEKMDPYKKGLPEDVQKKADDFWISFYKMLMERKENILRVGYWCFNDQNSWRNDFPMHGRTDYATLFNRDNTPKPTIGKLIELVQPKCCKDIDKNKKNNKKKK